MYIQASPAPSLFLMVIKYEFTETLSELCEYCFVAEIINDKPTDDRTDARFLLLFPFVITIGDCALGGGDICCYLLDS